MDHSPGFLALVQDSRTRVREVTVEEFPGRLEAGERVVLLDVREDHEWEAGHLPGAQHMGRGILERDIERELPEKDTPIVLYCGGGYRSLLSADSLQRMGYTRVESLVGGWSGWVGQGLPVEGPATNA
ncbi:MAG: rhodanese-like domain-containing protein [bacterium]